QGERSWRRRRSRRDRLAEIKRRYDPSNLFRMNQNVKPMAAVRAA
ncbi:BBE domain-containing protein, partial [Rhizobium leguminosarum]